MRHEPLTGPLRYGSPESRRREERAFTRAFDHMVMFAIGGVIVAFLLTFGHFNPGTRLARPPGEPIGLGLISDGSVVTLTRDRELYVCSEDDCHSADFSPPPEDVNRPTLEQPCAQAGGVSFFHFRPRKVMDCLSLTTEYADAREVALVTLLEDGEVWTWSRSTNHMHIFVFPIFAGIGAVLGSLVALVRNLTIRRSR